MFPYLLWMEKLVRSEGGINCVCSHFRDEAITQRGKLPMRDLTYGPIRCGFLLPDGFFISRRLTNYTADDDAEFDYDGNRATNVAFS
jgi:hypothetical protein